MEVVPNDVESLSARRASASVFSSLPDESATTTIGGYAQLSWAFNYLGPAGNQRDEVTVIRRRGQEVRY